MCCETVTDTFSNNLKGARKILKIEFIRPQCETAVAKSLSLNNYVHFNFV